MTVRGVLHVHSAPPALSPHVEWAVAGVLGVPVSMPWVNQSAAPGMLRAELGWEGQAGMAGEITSAAEQSQCAQTTIAMCGDLIG